MHRAGSGLLSVSMVVDLHTHSTASDGRGTPAEVVAEAAAAGLSAIALTDHDTTAGIGAARTSAATAGIRVLSGIEISTRWAGMSVHLLGYGDCLVGDAGLGAMLADTIESREGRIVQMARRLAAGEPGVDGDDLVAALLRSTPPGATPGRPHLADALIQLNVVPDRDAAFQRLLAEPGPYYVPYAAPSTADAIAAVVAAGGLAVIAHARSPHGGRTLSDAQIADLAAAGLAGLEVDHRDHDDAAKAGLRALARSLDLVVTGSSDYHGSGKQNRLGEHSTAPEVVEELAGRLGGRW